MSERIATGNSFHSGRLCLRLTQLVVATLVVLTCAATSHATIFGSIRGVVHDPQHHPVQGVNVVLKAKSSEWSKTASTDADGEFNYTAVPIGEYSVRV